jgi:hypothetical protein
MLAQAMKGAAKFDLCDFYPKADKKGPYAIPSWCGKQGMTGMKERLPRAIQNIEAKKLASENDKIVEDSAALQESSANKALARCEQARKLSAEQLKARAETRRMSLKGMGVAPS